MTTFVVTMNRQEQDRRNEIQRAGRAANGNTATKKYEKTKKGFLMRAHRNMRSRVAGIQAAYYHLYSHIQSVVPRDDFYEWALGLPEFHSLFDAWEASGYDRRLTPSVDRVDSSKGYSFDNMEWVTSSENSRRSAVNRTKLTKESAAKVRDMWNEFPDGDKMKGRAALLSELGISYHTGLMALDDEFLKRKGLL